MKKESLTAMRLLAKAVAKILMAKFIPVKSFNHILKQEIVAESKRQNPSYNYCAIAAQVGLDRRYVAECLNDINQQIRPSQIDLIYHQVESRCEQKGSQKIKKKGQIDTFESICKKMANGALTPSSIANDLMKQGRMVDIGGYYRLCEPEENRELDIAADAAIKQIDALTEDLVPEED